MLFDDLDGEVVTLWAPGGTRTVTWSLPGTTVFNIQAVAEFLKPQPQLPKEIFRGGLMHLPFPRCWFEFAVNGWRYAAYAHYENSTNITIDQFCDEGRDELHHTRLVSTVIARWNMEIDEKGILQGITHNAAYRGLKDVPGRATVADPFQEAETTCLYGAVAIYLSNWKQDVSTRLERPTRQQRRQAERTGKLPPMEQRSLVIAPWVTKFASVATDEGGGWEQRWHAVRGHSRTWTEDAPMYGCDKCRANGTGHGTEGTKSHVGMFWIRSYFAGKKSLGEIEHRYEIGTLPPT